MEIHPPQLHSKVKLRPKAFVLANVSSQRGSKLPSSDLITNINMHISESRYKAMLVLMFNGH